MTTTTRQRLGAGFVVLLAALVAMAPLTLNLYLPAFPHLAAELGTGAEQVQLTLTAALVGLALGQLVIGSVSDAVGRRRPLLVGISLHVLLSLAIAVVGSVELLVALRFLHGLVAAAGIVIAVAVVRDVYEGVRVGKTLSRLMLVVGVAPVVAPALGSQLLLVGSWRLLFVVLAVLGAVQLALVALWMPETLPPESRRRGGTRAAVRAYVALLRDPTYLGLVLVAGLAMLGQFTYISTSTFLFQETYGLSAQQFGLIFGLGAVTVTTGTQVAGALMGRVRAERLVLGALVVALCGAAAMIVVAGAVGTGPGRLWPLLAALLPTIGSIGVLLPTVPAIALARQSHDAGSAAALIGASQFGMAAVGAPLSGLLGSSVTIMATVMIGAFTVAGVIMGAVVRRGTRL
ncbi:Bcr/CflA family efflux MFS transporter [Georgenia sp. SYP-B2076]|uniref:Bcr/CflA family efflux MFS transporter n=1 Tax=Georgenia sp. SYP-B2076 TaxID=2495881 RepID=UPI000F8D8EB9|nr:Bcr/CflA family efflux MFS transporter [Georgenia sp. SYP-B2076]